MSFFNQEEIIFIKNNRKYLETDKYSTFLEMSPPSSRGKYLEGLLRIGLSFKDIFPSTYIPNRFFKGCEFNSKIEISSEIKGITDEAFYYCKFNEPVVIESSFISQEAFLGSIFKKSLELKEGISLIGSLAFNDVSLNKVVIPKGVGLVGKGCFSNSEIREAVLSNLKKIPKDMFKDCYDLVRVSLPIELKSIGESAFSFTGGVGKWLELSYPGTKKEFDSITKDLDWNKGTRIRLICKEGIFEYTEGYY